MACKGLRFAYMGWRNLLSAGPAMKVALFGVALIPVIFAGFYLSAFFDPYSNLSSIPVAVVNEDEGAVISDEQRNIGDDVCDELRNGEDGFGWAFVSAEQAKKGMEKGEYYMICTIPKDFSAGIASADTDAPTRAQMTVTYDQSENMLASQIGSSAWEKVKLKVNETIVEEYWNTIFNTVSDAGDDLRTAADGAGELADGLGSAVEGNATITSNLGTLADGAGQVQAGTETLSSGMAALADGSGQVSSGLNELNSQTSDMTASTTTLATGAQSVADGVAQLSISLGAANTAATTISGSLTSLAGTTGSLAQLSGASTSYISAAITAVEPLASSADADTRAAAKAALDSLNNAQSSNTTVSGGLGNLKTGISNLNTQVALPLIGGIQDAIAATDATGKLGGGANQVAAGAQKLNASTPALVGGVQKLASGAGDLDSGVRSARSGADQLASATPALTDGAAQLASGSQTLGEGLSTAQDGSKTLADSLAEGSESMVMSASEIASKSSMMSQPVDVNEEYYTSVANYGTGFSPFFLGLGIWVGCIFAGFLFKPINSRLAVSGGNPIMVAFSGFIPLGLFAVLQAVIALAFVQFALGVQINNVAAYYGMGILCALSFMAIMQFLVAAFGFPGRFIAVVLLTLQLTSAAGTFPVQTAPEFFNIINPWMPMSYVVEGLRQIMTGTSLSVAGFDAAVLASFGLVFFCLTVIYAYRKRTVNMVDIHPLLDL